MYVVTLVYILLTICNTLSGCFFFKSLPFGKFNKMVRIRQERAIASFVFPDYSCDMKAIRK